MQIREILDQKHGEHALYSIAPHESAFRAARVMTDKNIGALVVLSNNQVVGVVSERDIMSRVVSKDLDSHTVTVNQIMSTHLVVADADESYESCMEKMKAAHCRHILIMDEHALVGLVSVRDILDASAIAREVPVTVDEKRIWTMPEGSTLTER